MASTEKIYFYPGWLRLWHGLNALGIIILIVTGLSMNASLESPLIGFSLAVSLHNIAGVLVSFLYVVYIIGNMMTPNGTFYLFKLKGFLRRIVKQAYYYAWGMFHGMDYPFPLSAKRKFNPLQQFAYVSVMYFVVPVLIITGFALLFPETIIENVYGLSGVFVTAILHSAVGFFVSIFLIIHLYVASIGKSPVENFKSIISGWHHI